MMCQVKVLTNISMISMSACCLFYSYQEIYCIIINRYIFYFQENVHSKRSWWGPSPSAPTSKCWNVLPRRSCRKYWRRETRKKKFLRETYSLFLPPHCQPSKILDKKRQTKTQWCTWGSSCSWWSSCQQPTCAFFSRSGSRWTNRLGNHWTCSVFVCSVAEIDHSLQILLPDDLQRRCTQCNNNRSWSSPSGCSSAPPWSGSTVGDSREGFPLHEEQFGLFARLASLCPCSRNIPRLASRSGWTGTFSRKPRCGSRLST